MVKKATQNSRMKLQLKSFEVQNFRNIKHKNLNFIDNFEVLDKQNLCILEAMDFYCQYVNDSSGGRDTLANWGGIGDIVSYQYRNNIKDCIPIEFKATFVDNTNDTDLVYFFSLQPHGRYKITTRKEYLRPDTSTSSEYLDFSSGSGTASIGLQPANLLKDGALALNAYGTLNWSPVKDIYNHICSWRIYDLDLGHLLRDSAWCTYTDLKAGRNFGSVLNAIKNNCLICEEYIQTLKEVFPNIYSLGDQTYFRNFELQNELDGSLTIRSQFSECGDEYFLPYRLLPKDFLYSAAILAITYNSIISDTRPGLIAYKSPFIYLDSRTTARLQNAIRKISTKYKLPIALNSQNYNEIDLTKNYTDQEL